MFGHSGSRWFRAETGFFLAVWLIFSFNFQERAFFDPGALWHTVVGGKILDSGFMTIDPFTYTHPNSTWIPQQWGGEVLMALLHRLSGFDAMLLAFTTGIALLYTLLFSRLRQAGMHWTFAAMVCGGFLFVGSFHFFLRPHMATIGFMAYTMAVLVDFDRGRASINRVAGLILVYILWTNIHGGVLGGTLSVGIALAGWFMLFLAKRGGPVPTWRVGITLVGILACCALTPFANPFGMEMINTWTRIVGSKVMPLYVGEHKPIQLSEPLDQLLALSALVYLVLFAGVLSNWREFRATWLVPLVWLVLMFKGIRQGPLFAVTAIVVLADFWPHTYWHQLLRKYGDSLVYGDSSPVGWRWLVVPILAVATALGLQLGGVRVPLVGAGWAQMPKQFVPIDITDAIDKELATFGPQARVFNDCNLGGYLIYYHRGYPIYMDDRFELYGDPWTEEYVQMALYHPERIEAACDKYRCTHALVAHEKTPIPFEIYLSQSKGWQEVARGQGAVLYRRITPPPSH
ncbi:MAG: hypothetical protein ACRC8S_22730 [Fimbriiglobus sp.]